MWIKRDIELHWSGFGPSPVRILKGVRQCGKSALMQRLGRKVTSLDDLSLRESAQNDPQLFLDLVANPVALDEVQYAPALFAEIKKRVDDMKSAARHGQVALPWPEDGQYWLSGSNQILMRKGVQESLAGRATNLTLHPLSVHELKVHGLSTDFKSLLLKGGWPELHATVGIDPIAYLNDYIHAVLEKDVTMAAGIQKVSAFGRVLKLLAARVGSLLNLSDVAKDASVQVSTVTDWVGFLEEMLFVTRLAPFSTNLNQRVVKTPKILFNDVSLACRLQGWREPEAAALSPQAGGLFETLVWSELLKTRDHGREPWDFFFWRTKEGHEVDFLIHTAEKTLALETKFSVQNIPRDLDFQPLFKVFGSRLQCAVVVAGGEQREVPAKMPSRVDAVPLNHLAEFVRNAMNGDM
jgi:predicted AAA+ superfamily ATPase